MPTGAGLRPGAKAPDEPPDPIGGAPALDPTGERGEETYPRDSACGPVAKAPDKPPTPTGYAPLLDSTVRREKALFLSGCESRPGECSGQDRGSW